MIPAAQRRRVEAADLMNLIRREGAEVNVASSAFSAGNVQVAQGDYIVRMDQPYSAVCETLLGVQFYAPENPRPYDDTGWAIPLLRNLKVSRIEDKSILDKPMTLAAADLDDRRRDWRQRQDADRRSHDREHAGDVPLRSTRT